MSAIDHFNGYLRDNPEVRRIFLVSLAERRAQIIERAFRDAKSTESLEHERGKVALIDELTTSYEKENANAARRAEATDRATR